MCSVFRTRPADCSRISAAAALKGGDKDAADRKGGKKTKSNSGAKLQTTESAQRLLYTE